MCSSDLGVRHRAMQHEIGQQRLQAGRVERRNGQMGRGEAEPAQELDVQGRDHGVPPCGRGTFPLPAEYPYQQRGARLPEVPGAVV